MGWSEIALVLAGGAGPLVIALVTMRHSREVERERWHREDTDEELERWAAFIAACTQVMADWADVASLPPQTREEERALDQRRDLHYDALNSVSSMVRLTAPVEIVAAAEGMLAQVRETAVAARVPDGSGRLAQAQAGFATARDNLVAAIRRRRNIAD